MHEASYEIADAMRRVRPSQVDNFYGEGAMRAWVDAKLELCRVLRRQDPTFNQRIFLDRTWK